MHTTGPYDTELSHPNQNVHGVKVEKPSFTWTNTPYAALAENNSAAITFLWPETRWLMASLAFSIHSRWLIRSWWSPKLISVSSPSLNTLKPRDPCIFQLFFW